MSKSKQHVGLCKWCNRKESCTRGFQVQLPTSNPGSFCSPATPRDARRFLSPLSRKEIGLAFYLPLKISVVLHHHSNGLHNCFTGWLKYLKDIWLDIVLNVSICIVALLINSGSQIFYLPYRKHLSFEREFQRPYLEECTNWNWNWGAEGHLSFWHRTVIRYMQASTLSHSQRTTDRG